MSVDYKKMNDTIRLTYARQALVHGDQTIADNIAAAGYKPVTHSTVAAWRHKFGFVDKTKTDGTITSAATSASSPVTSSKANFDTHEKSASRPPLTTKTIVATMRGWSKKRHCPQSKNGDVLLVKDDNCAWLVSRQRYPRSEIWVESPELEQMVVDGSKLYSFADIAQSEDMELVNSVPGELNTEDDLPYGVEEVWRNSDFVSWGGGQSTLESLDRIVAETEKYSGMRPSNWKLPGVNQDMSCQLGSIKLESNGRLQHTDGDSAVIRSSFFRLERNHLDYASIPIPALKEALMAAKKLYGSRWRYAPVEFGTGEYSNENERLKDWEDNHTKDTPSLPSTKPAYEYGRETAVLIKVGVPGNRIIIKTTCGSDQGSMHPNLSQVIPRTGAGMPLTEIGPINVGELRSALKNAEKRFKRSTTRLKISGDDSALLSFVPDHDNYMNGYDNSLESDYDKSEVDRTIAAFDTAELPSLQDQASSYKTLNFHTKTLLNLLAGLNTSAEIILSGDGNQFKGNNSDPFRPSGFDANMIWQVTLANAGEDPQKPIDVPEFHVWGGILKNQYAHPIDYQRVDL